MLFIIVVVFAWLVRTFTRFLKKPVGHSRPVTFPVFSLTMLSIALLLLVSGTLMTLFWSDVYGSAIAALGGVFGTIESHVRHKREASEP